MEIITKHTLLVDIVLLLLKQKALGVKKEVRMKVKVGEIGVEEVKAGRGRKYWVNGCDGGQGYEKIGAIIRIGKKLGEWTRRRRRKSEGQEGVGM